MNNIETICAVVALGIGFGCGMAMSHTHGFLGFVVGFFGSLLGVATVLGFIRLISGAVRGHHRKRGKSDLER